MKILLTLASLLLVTTEPAQTPEAVVLQHITRTGCLYLPHGKPTLPSPPEKTRAAVKLMEKSGFLKWKGGRAQLSGELKAESESEVAKGRPGLEGITRQQLFTRFATAEEQGWSLPDLDDSSSLQRMTPAEAREIAHAAAQANITSSLGPAKLDRTTLPRGIRIAESVSVAEECPTWLTISRVAYWQNWAFLETGASWAPLAGSGAIWALRRDGTKWRIVGRQRTWVS